MDAICFLEELISIPSPSGYEDGVAHFLVTKMSELGFRAHCDEAGNAIGVIGNHDAEQTIVLLGHMDTVPGHVPVHREGNRLYGRGAVDAKGPLAAFVLAAAQAAAKLNTRLVVVGAVEEEAHSRGAHLLKQSMQAPTYALIGEPSGWQGITLGYKGAMSVQYRLTRPGKHVAGQGPTPAEEAIIFWNRLTAHAHQVNGGRDQGFDTLDPSLRTMQTTSDGLHDGMEMTIDLRLPPSADSQVLRRLMQSWADGATLAFPYSEPAFRADKSTPVVRSLLRAIRAEGGNPRFKIKTGTSDMNVVGPVWNCPIVAYGPGNSALDHAPNEHIEISEFLQGLKVLVHTLESLGS